MPDAAAFRVAVKDHVMIAHSLSGAVFGPAQRLHGATYEVITEYAAADVDADGIDVASSSTSMSSKSTSSTSFS